MPSIVRVIARSTTTDCEKSVVPKTTACRPSGRPCTVSALVRDDLAGRHDDRLDEHVGALRDPEEHRRQLDVVLGRVVDAEALGDAVALVPVGEPPLRPQRRRRQAHAVAEPAAAVVDLGPPDDQVATRGDDVDGHLGLVAGRDRVHVDDLHRPRRHRRALQRHAGSRRRWRSRCRRSPTRRTGCVSTSCSLLFSAVKPSARYHVDDGCVVHGATDVPAGCVARCSTSPPPPSISTIALANGVRHATRRRR